MTQRDTTRMTTAGLNLIQQALTIYDADLDLAVCNRRFQEMFDLPDRLVTPGAHFEDTIRFLAERGDYGEVTDLDRFVADRVETARAFEPHYMERTRANGRTISVEGSPLPQGGWVTVYTDISRAKQQEALLAARSEELSDRLVTYSDDLAAANRQLESTIIALEEAKRQASEAEARMRLTTEMVPAHIAHVGPDRRYTYSNRRLSLVMPGSTADPVGLAPADALGDETFANIAPISTAPMPASRRCSSSPTPPAPVASAWRSPPIRHRRGLYPVDGHHRRGPDPRRPGPAPPPRNGRPADLRPRA